MEVVAKSYQDQLERIKENVKNAYEAFRPNYERFHEFRKFVFETSLSQDDITLLTNLKKPQIEFNISEAYISRLMGEFSKQEPAIMVSADDETKADPVTVHVTEQHIRHLMLDSKNDHVRWNLMKDLYSGGFGVGKIWTDYANAMSFDQVINWDVCQDPTLVGFDPMARRSHKGDGRFCFELFPYTKETFKKEFPKVDVERLTFSRSYAGFNWSYVNGREQIILVCDYYEKKSRRVKIVQLANNEVKTLKEYEEMAKSWTSIEPLPAIKGKPRWTEIETICRYRCIENQVLEYSETDFTYFPLVFFDGNSIMIKNPKTSGAVEQVIRPYVYHAKGAQRLKNFAGITLANELENIVQHKFLIAKEALPKEKDFQQALLDVQKPNTLVYNAFFEQNPDKPIPMPIREVNRVPTPPEVIQTFASTDSLIQNILGSYDSSLGINDNQLSGVAIIEAATQSNAAAMPYIVGFLQGLQRIAEIFVDLIPKYYITPRTIPVRGIDGKADYVKINQDQGVSMFYDTNALNVKIEAGVSFQIQKSRALQQLIALQQASPLFAQFMNEKGLGVLLDNIEIRGIDRLKMMVEDWQQELAQQKAMAMKMQQEQMQNNPAMMKNNIEMAKVQQKGQELAMKQQSSMAEFQMDMQRLRQGERKVLADLAIAKDSNMTQRLKAETERFAKKIDLAIKNRDVNHRHLKEAIDLRHRISQPQREYSR
jgi:uncharacterized protein YeaO (DUF488 family)